MTSLCVCVSWCLSASLFVRPVSISLCACVSVPVCVFLFVCMCVCACVCACMCLPLCVLFVCVCACGVCLCTVCVCARLCLYLCLRVCVCMCFFAVCLCRSLKFCVYLCLLLLRIWHSISISFLLIICIIFNEAFICNVFDTTNKRVTCSSTLSGHPSSSSWPQKLFLAYHWVYHITLLYWLILCTHCGQSIYFSLASLVHDHELGVIKSSWESIRSSSPVIDGCTNTILLDGAPKIAFSCLVSGWILWFMVRIAIDCKPTYNWGAPSCTAFHINSS